MEDCRLTESKKERIQLFCTMLMSQESAFSSYWHSCLPMLRLVMRYLKLQMGEYHSQKVAKSCIVNRLLSVECLTLVYSSDAYDEQNEFEFNWFKLVKSIIKC